MTWRTPWHERVAPAIVRGLWQGASVAALAARHRCDRADVRRVATEAGLTLTTRDGAEVAREGSGWCRVLVGGTVYERARRLPDGMVSLINSGPRAGAVVVPWAAVEAVAPVVRYGQRAAATRRWHRVTVDTTTPPCLDSGSGGVGAG